jgi:hypothetical protein
MFNTSETSGNALPEVFNLTDRWICAPEGGHQPSADEIQFYPNPIALGDGLSILTATRGSRSHYSPKGEERKFGK